MGTCSSVHKARSSVLTPSSKTKPLKEGSTVMASSDPSLKSSSFGSKEEFFFDSKEWLDSDCDDDFFSVNGDFTPSRRSTPNHQISTISTSQPLRTLTFDGVSDSKSVPSPTGRKKLLDLFHETSQLKGSSEKLLMNGEQLVLDDTKLNQTPEKGNLVSSSNLTPTGDLKYRKKVGQCCLPSFRPSFSFNERRQKTSPVH